MVAFSNLCADISFQSDTRLLGVLGTPGLKGQKGDVVSMWDEFGRSFKGPAQPLPAILNTVHLIDLSQWALKE